jgi:hypothetical protein
LKVSRGGLDFDAGEESGGFGVGVGGVADGSVTEGLVEAGIQRVEV